MLLTNVRLMPVSPARKPVSQHAYPALSLFLSHQLLNDYFRSVEHEFSPHGCRKVIKAVFFFVEQTSSLGKQPPSPHQQLLPFSLRRVGTFCY